MTPKNSSGLRTLLMGGLLTAGVGAALIGAKLDRAETPHRGPAPAPTFSATIERGRPTVPAPAPRPIERVEVAVGDAPSRGPSEAPVTIVSFLDFECPHCGQTPATLKRLAAEFKDQVRFVFKNMPARSHPRAREAAQAAMAAHAQGKFWEYQDKIFASQPHLEREDLVGYAKQLKLAHKKVRGALEAGTFADRVDADYQQGKALGVRGTPTSFVNGRPLRGAQSYETFRRLVEEELGRPAT